MIRKRKGIRMKLNEEDLNQLNSRVIALNSVQVLHQMAQREMQIFNQELIRKYKLDEKKRYKLDFKTGEILEVKEEPINEG